MNMKNDDLTTDTISSQSELIELVTQNAEKLSDVLEREYRALLIRDVSLINSLASEKAALLDSLSRLEPYLREIYNEADVQEGEDSVKQLLQLCKDMNSRNHSLVLIAMDQNRKTLSLLRGVLNIEQTNVYSANGELAFDRSKRYLGSA